MLDSLEEAFGDAESWFRNARHLHAGAVQLLENMPRNNDVRATDFSIGSLKGTLLLLGFAVENALKGVIVAENTPSIKEGRVEVRKLFGDPSQQHDLVKLHDKTGKNFLSADPNLLEKLTAIICWAGRYPAPIKMGHFDSAVKLNPRSLVIPCDVDLVLKLIEDCEAACSTRSHD